MATGPVDSDSQAYPCYLDTQRCGVDGGWEEEWRYRRLLECRGGVLDERVDQSSDGGQSRLSFGRIRLSSSHGNV